MTEYEKAVDFWRGMQMGTAAELAFVLDSYSVSFAYHSGRIENPSVTYYDTREIFRHDSVTRYTGDLRTLFEIRNEKGAYELFLTAFDERRPLDEALVKEFQKALTKNTYDARRWEIGERPGEYKLHDYVTGIDEVGALPEDVPAEMAELLEEMRDFAKISDARSHRMNSPVSGAAEPCRLFDEASLAGADECAAEVIDGGWRTVPADDVLTAAAYFHAKFEGIHPFADGNGRTGRLAMNYFLVTHASPPIIIHAEDKKDYYDALRAFDAAGDLAPLKEFLRDQTVKTWRKRRERNKQEDDKK